jgi:Recombination endonuclease VII
MANIGKGKFYMVNNATHKKCPICGELKERSEYWKWKSRQDGLAAYCIPCFAERNEKWNKDNPEKLKSSSIASSRKSRFGISREDYAQMLVDQNNSCAICATQIGWEAAVDHCHTTNKIRGLLCRKCNLGLGGFKDNIETIRKAIAYVKGM